MRISVLNRPLFNSFLGVMDIKQGAMLIVLFGLLNKVAGVYGLLGSLSAGGTIGQISYYIYSAASLAAFVLGLKAVSDEQTTKLFTFCHFYAVDHLLNTFYTLVFAIDWWCYVPHDGKHVANSDAQRDMVALAKSRGEIGGEEISVEERTRIAMQMWKKEKVFAIFVLVGCWVVKVYFILLLYSFVSHLRQNTYRALPLTTATPSPSTPPTSARRSTKNASSSSKEKETETEGEEHFNWDSDEETRAEGGAEGAGSGGRVIRGENIV
ncbi:Inositolphosphorylceramide synthase subunit Kei1-domain-containing protein [Mrakia frigida]|uniref:Kei1p n=1 Tax=Mrakia frigida TaxID=29902 RepID=UPI003FCC26EC